MQNEYTVKEIELINFKKRRYVRSMVAKAVAKGELPKATMCELCKEQCNTQAHHIDYGQPLKVLWLCRKCHGIVHKKKHPLNPNNNKQTPLPCCLDKYQMVSVSFTMPIKNFLALKAESEKKGKPISALLKDEALKNYPIKKDQLEFKFKEEEDDYSQFIPNKRVQSVETHEKLLPKSKRPLLQEVRSKRDLNMSGMEPELFAISERHGRNAFRLQRASAN